MARVMKDVCLRDVVSGDLPVFFEQQLDPGQFWRVHRGIIVQIGEILEARRDLRGRYTLRLKSRPEPLRTSQTYGHHFKQM